MTLKQKADLYDLYVEVEHQHPHRSITFQLALVVHLATRNHIDCTSEDVAEAIREKKP